MNKCGSGKPKPLHRVPAKLTKKRAAAHLAYEARPDSVRRISDEIRRRAGLPPVPETRLAAECRALLGNGHVNGNGNGHGKPQNVYVVRVPDADRIRDGLRAAAQRRAAGQREFDEGTAELRLWLRKAKDADGLQMTEAAKLGGVSRPSAYEMVEQAD